MRCVGPDWLCAATQIVSTPRLEPLASRPARPTCTLGLAFAAAQLNWAMLFERRTLLWNKLATNEHHITELVYYFSPSHWGPTGLKYLKAPGRQGGTLPTFEDLECLHSSVILGWFPKICARGLYAKNARSAIWRKYGYWALGYRTGMYMILPFFSRGSHKLLIFPKLILVSIFRLAVSLWEAGKPALSQICPVFCCWLCPGLVRVLGIATFFTKIFHLTCQEYPKIHSAEACAIAGQGTVEFQIQTGGQMEYKRSGSL